MRILSAVAAALALSACASSSSIQPQMSRMHAQQGGRASLVVMGDPTIAPKLRESVKILLGNAEAYELVDESNIAPRTRIEIFVTQAVPVDRTKRVLLGPLAGRARLTAQVVVRQDDQIVDSFVITTQSSAGTPLSGTTSQAIGMAADRIAERLTS